MATINLGAIKFNWQGAYAGGTAYAVDDVVSYNGSSYVCKLASTGNLPTNATYWDQMSSAGTNGTNGTDLTSTLTTQGDILYRDGSGLQRLGAGTSGQFLKTLGTGANPLWGDAGGGIVQVKYRYQDLNSTTTSSSYVDTGQEVTITPTSASNDIFIIATFCRQAASSRGRYTFNKSGDTSGNGDLHTNIFAGADAIATFEGATNRNQFMTMVHLDTTVASTNAITYKTRHNIQDGSTTNSFGNIGGNGLQMFAIEIDGGIVS
jgi:hypothetical protein